MIKSLKPSFWFGMGSFIGEGKQPLPWIHIDDLCNLIKHAVENRNVNGVLNGVAPDIITNADFTRVRCVFFCLQPGRNQKSTAPLEEFIQSV